MPRRARAATSDENLSRPPRCPRPIGSAVDFRSYACHAKRDRKSFRINCRHRSSVRETDRARDGFTRRKLACERCFLRRANCTRSASARSRAFSGELDSAVTARCTIARHNHHSRCIPDSVRHLYAFDQIVRAKNFPARLRRHTDSNHACDSRRLLRCASRVRFDETRRRFDYCD